MVECVSKKATTTVTKAEKDKWKTELRKENQWECETVCFNGIVLLQRNIA